MNYYLTLMSGVHFHTSYKARMHISIREQLSTVMDIAHDCDQTRLVGCYAMIDITVYA